jgi:hypothetical protein
MAGLSVAAVGLSMVVAGRQCRLPVSWVGRCGWAIAGLSEVVVPVAGGVSLGGRWRG